MEGEYEQVVIIVNFKKDADITDIVGNFYIHNEDDIDSMESYTLKKNTDKMSQVKEVIEK